MTKNKNLISFLVLGLLMILLSIGAGSSYLWVPLVWPQASVQRDFERRLSALESLEKDQSKDVEEDLKKLAASVAQEMNLLRSQIKIAEHPQVVYSNSAQNIPLLLAFIDLKLKIQLGEPFSIELDQLKKLTKADVSALEEYAQSGIPTLRFLAQEFKSISQQMALAQEDQQATTTWEKTKVIMRRLVTVEKMQPTNDASLPVTSEFQSLYSSILQGNVRFVLERLPKNEMLEKWRTHAEAYVKAMDTLNKLSHQLFFNEAR